MSVSSCTFVAGSVTVTVGAGRGAGGLGGTVTPTITASVALSPVVALIWVARADAVIVYCLGWSRVTAVANVPWSIAPLTGTGISGPESSWTVTDGCPVRDHPTDPVIVSCRGPLSWLPAWLGEVMRTRGSAAEVSRRHRRRVARDWVPGHRWPHDRRVVRVAPVRVGLRWTQADAVVERAADRSVDLDAFSGCRDALDVAPFQRRKPRAHRERRQRFDHHGLARVRITAEPGQDDRLRRGHSRHGVGRRRRAHAEVA